MSSSRLVLAIVLAIPAICRAQDLSPGLWQITVQTHSAAMPTDTAPLQTSQCLTAADADDPSKVLGSIAAPGASGCTYSDKRYAGSAFHFEMECSGTLAIKASGDVTFTAQALSGTIDILAAAGGQPVEMRSSISARRVGDCSPTP